MCNCPLQLYSCFFCIKLKPNARIAITGDEDWISVLTEVRNILIMLQGHSPEDIGGLDLTGSRPAMGSYYGKFCYLRERW